MLSLGQALSCLSNLLYVGTEKLLSQKSHTEYVHDLHDLRGSESAASQDTTSRPFRNMPSFGHEKPT